MKLVKLKIPLSKATEFAHFLVSLSIDCIISWATEGFDDYLHVIVNLNANDVPVELKEEKLKEKFGQYIKNK